MFHVLCDSVFCAVWFTPGLKFCGTMQKGKLEGCEMLPGAYPWCASNTGSHPSPAKAQGMLQAPAPQLGRVTRPLGTWAEHPWCSFGSGMLPGERPVTIGWHQPCAPTLPRKARVLTKSLESFPSIVSIKLERKTPSKGNLGVRKDCFHVQNTSNMNNTENPVSEDDDQLRKCTQNSEKKHNVMNTSFCSLPPLFF